MNIPMLDLKQQYKLLKEEIDNAVEEVMTSTQFILGSNVKKLEADIAEFCQVNFGIGVASGSDALHLALLACGVQQGDEVIVPSFTFFATAGAVARTGAKPVFVDIDPKTYNLDPDKLERAVSKRTKAIIPVHLYGQACDMDAICDFASMYNLVVIEDAAQAIGATYKQTRVGSFGHAACFSFFPTKNLGAYGDAGMIVTNDEQIAEKVRVLRVHGSKPKYHHHVLGYNSRLDELQAAILNVKFRYMESWNQSRRDNARKYTQLLKESLGDAVVTPYEADDHFHIYHQYTIRVSERDQLQAYLKENGISTMVYYPVPLHLQPVFSELGYREGDLPVTETACREVISLPMFPELNDEQQAYIVSKITDFYMKKGGY